MDKVYKRFSLNDTTKLVLLQLFLMLTIMTPNYPMLKMGSCGYCIPPAAHYRYYAPELRTSVHNTSYQVSIIGQLLTISKNANTNTAPFNKTLESLFGHQPEKCYVNYYPDLKCWVLSAKLSDKWCSKYAYDQELSENTLWVSHQINTHQD